MRGATPIGATGILNGVISIHAPHAGSDDFPLCYSIPQRISIHAPHAGSDAKIRSGHHLSSGFQSTPPMRGATSSRMMSSFDGCYFNPRPPCGERPEDVTVNGEIFRISIHAPHAGSDNHSKQTTNQTGGFQSTPPMRGATALYVVVVIALKISIHAPHAGSDALQEFQKCGF